jgi:hypothetical protein
LTGGKQENPLAQPHGSLLEHGFPDELIASIDYVCNPALAKQYLDRTF